MMEHRRQAMMLRTKRFAQAVIRLYASLSRSTIDQVFGKENRPNVVRFQMRPDPLAK